MTISRVPSGVPAGGQFAISARDEATVSLGNASRDNGRNALTSLLFGTAEEMISRENPDGTFTDVQRQEDIEDVLREHCPTLGEAEFDDRVAIIGRLAELISQTERADDDDTEAYEAAADEVGFELDDFPVEEYDGDGVYSDCAAFKTGVIEELDVRLYSACASLAAAEVEACESARPSSAVA